MTLKKVLISTTSFGKYNSTPLDMLKEKDLELAFNPFGRALTSKEVIELGSGIEGLIAGTEPLDAETLSKLKGLRVISRCGAGISNVDLNKAKDLSIKVFNTPDGPTLAVAELTVGLMLSALRKINLMDRQLRNGKWNKLMGSLLKGKKVGIIGLGRIGKKVTEFLEPFGAELYFTDPALQGKNYGTVKNCELDEIVALADIISVHIPYLRSNEYIINSEKISLMKKSGILINCSRGKIVDEKALCRAL